MGPELARRLKTLPEPPKASTRVPDGPKRSICTSFVMGGVFSPGLGTVFGELGPFATHFALVPEGQFWAILRSSTAAVRSPQAVWGPIPMGLLVSRRVPTTQVRGLHRPMYSRCWFVGLPACVLLFVNPPPPGRILLRSRTGICPKHVCDPTPNP